MVGNIESLVTRYDKNTHLILVNKLLKEIMVYTLEKLS
jgi:hypothetical protein